MMMEHHMIFLAMFLVIVLYSKENYNSFREVVNGLRNFLYCFHLSHCNSVLSYIMQVLRCFEYF